MNSTWKKSGLVVLVAFLILYIYALSKPEINKGLGNTESVTTFIGILAFGYYLLKNNQTPNQEMTPSQKLAANFYKFSLIFISIILVSMIYILIKDL